ncbi:S1 family peptidase [Pendulispora brunnea]|uniref:S1 family peptidase n=1 Tax=Pendulispora brunnea TaxID=2905690 RepID=A0ABZ2KRG6_9BACT
MTGKDKRTGQDLVYICTGTIVKVNKILTAAHCVNRMYLDWENPWISIRTGQNPTSDDPRFTISTVSWDAEFTGDWPKGHDFAVITLSSNTSGVTPIPVSRHRLEIKHLGSYLRITGYGRTSPGDVASGGTKRYADVGLGGLSEKTFTAGTNMPSTDPRAQTICYGDSGGPALADLGSGTEVIGVTSYTVNNCQEGWHVRTDTADATSFLKSAGVL